MDKGIGTCSVNMAYDADQGVTQPCTVGLNYLQKHFCH